MNMDMRSRPRTLANPLALSRLDPAQAKSDRPPIDLVLAAAADDRQRTEALPAVARRVASGVARQLRDQVRSAACCPGPQQRPRVPLVGDPERLTKRLQTRHLAEAVGKRRWPSADT
jgi:hypothetical protein